MTFLKRGHSWWGLWSRHGSGANFCTVGRSASRFWWTEHKGQGRFAFHLGCKCHWLKYSMSPVEKHKTGKYPLENLPSSASNSSKKEDTILKIDLTLQPMRPWAFMKLHSAVIRKCCGVCVHKLLQLRNIQDLLDEPIFCVTAAPSPCKTTGMALRL